MRFGRKEGEHREPQADRDTTDERTAESQPYKKKIAALERIIELQDIELNDLQEKGMINEERKHQERERIAKLDQACKDVIAQLEQTIAFKDEMIEIKDQRLDDQQRIIDSQQQIFDLKCALCEFKRAQEGSKQ